jgi:hypothetical protein
MTTEEAQIQRAGELHEVAVELKGVAGILAGVKTKQDRNGWLLIGVVIEGVLLLAALGLIAYLALPIVHTAKTVEHVAGPKAQKQQAASTQAFIAGFLCAQRENTSESRTMDGKPPLPLKKGCPPYNFDPNASILEHLTPPSTTTAPRRNQTTTTARNHGDTTTSTTPTTSTTQALHTPTTCPTITVADHCLSGG